MNHYLYLISNRFNSMIYIGARSTKKSIDRDHYMGSGLHLKRALKKYGRDSFIKSIIDIFSSEKEMYAKEREIVNKDFVNRSDTYNIARGGKGGIKLIPGTRSHTAWLKSVIKNNPNRKDKRSKKYKNWYIRNQENNPSSKDKNSNQYKKWSTSQSSASPNLMPKDSEQYKSWLHNKKKSMPNLMDRHSNEYRKWLRRRRVSAKKMKGRVVINNGKKSIHVKKEEVSMYKQNGWKLGLHHNKLFWINDGTQNRRVDPKILVSLTSSGKWKKGKRG